MEDKKEQVLLNITKDDSNVNVSLAKSVINWVVGLFSSPKKEVNDGQKAK